MFDEDQRLLECRTVKAPCGQPHRNDSTGLEAVTKCIGGARKICQTVVEAGPQSTAVNLDEMLAAELGTDYVIVFPVPDYMLVVHGWLARLA